MIPAMKHAVARYADRPQWRTVRPPLTELGEDMGRKLCRDLEAIHFAMPGYPSTTGDIT